MNMLKYSNTSELEGLKTIIGQESAIKAMELGLKRQWDRKNDLCT